MAKSNFKQMSEQTSSDNPAVKIIDFLAGNMPIVDLGKNHPSKYPYGIPEDINAELLNFLDHFQPETEKSGSYKKFYDAKYNSKIKPIPVDSFLINLNGRGNQIYSINEIDLSYGTNKDRVPATHKPSIAETNQTVLMYINYLIEKIPTIVLDQNHLAIRKESVGVISSLVTKYSLNSQAYNNLLASINSCKVVELSLPEFVGSIGAQEIKALSCTGLSQETLSLPMENTQAFHAEDVKKVEQKPQAQRKETDLNDNLKKVDDLIGKASFISQGDKNNPDAIKLMSLSQFDEIQGLVEENGLFSTSFTNLSNQVDAGKVVLLAEDAFNAILSD